MTRLLQFRAGRCERRGQTNLVDPLASKGLLYVESRPEDGELHHLCYKDLESGAIIDDFILFAGDATFKKVLVPNSSNARVYALCFSSSNQRVLYWMQDVDSSTDVTNVSRLNEFIDGSDEDMPIDILSDPTPAIQESHNPHASIPNATTEQMTQFDQLLAAFSAQSRPTAPFALADILTLEAISPLLDTDSSLCTQLSSYLPNNIEPTNENVKAIIRSTDFKNSVKSLDLALRNGKNLNEGLKMFFLHGLGLENGWEGVEEYVEAVRKKSMR
ncbi:hypothetical protein CROQUDRAFT_63764 [Cronartium quercuum f. sp. fusiforme G11]|uniref:Pru domain-containing protein n=1 Tax=Cronartium quercuum f. sp. fusiforme G11 TaxID=708437 RepID=A0A9P6TCE2_9BASI|nr:hypothetical protein CROQUDRAFT_63764 [Cronartium quercuum f. sp. fusiforme G11]